jgi:hypothetical protein
MSLTISPKQRCSHMLSFVSERTHLLRSHHRWFGPDRNMSQRQLLMSWKDADWVYLGSQYVNDFNYLGRTYKVVAQADGEFRRTSQDIARLKARKHLRRNGADRNGSAAQGPHDSLSCATAQPVPGCRGARGRGARRGVRDGPTPHAVKDPAHVASATATIDNAVVMLRERIAKFESREDGSIHKEESTRTKNARSLHQRRVGQRKSILRRGFTNQWATLAPPLNRATPHNAVTELFCPPPVDVEGTSLRPLRYARGGAGV